MTPAHDRIRQAAPQHEQLLRGLEEVDTAHARLSQNLSYIRDLDAQIFATAKKARQLRHKTLVESTAYERYRDSHVRKLAYKMTGRGSTFEKKASKEERDYNEALRAQKAAEEDLELARQMQIEAKIQTCVLEKQIKRHDALQCELGAFYNAVFGDPSPELADIGYKLERYNVTCRIHDEQAPVVAHERRIVTVLRKLDTQLNEARERLDKAEAASLADLGGGRTTASSMKRAYTRTAAEEVRKLRLLQDEFAAVAPDLPVLTAVDLMAPSNSSFDAFFDNVYSDMDAHSRIKKASRQLDSALRQCQDLLREHEAYFTQLTKEFAKAKMDFEAARVELQQASQEAFRRVLAGEEIGDASASTVPMEEPPPYSA